MPYINKADRLKYRVQFVAPPVETPGILNYQITCLINGFLRENGISYTNCNAAMGALEGAKMEFYRRVVAPYEDGKIEENGDVY